MRDALLALLTDDAPHCTLLRQTVHGLTDDEYLWEPVPECWSVRAGGTLDLSYPDPEPSPFTTIAWRLVHLTGSIGVAVATVLGTDTPDAGHGAPTTAADAAARALDAIGALQDAVGSSSEDDLRRPTRQWWDPTEHLAPVGEHVLWFGCYEPAAHAAEVRLLRDLWRHTGGGRR